MVGIRFSACCMDTRVLQLLRPVCWDGCMSPFIYTHQVVVGTRASSMHRLEDDEHW